MDKSFVLLHRLRGFAIVVRALALALRAMLLHCALQSQLCSVRLGGSFPKELLQVLLSEESAGTVFQAPCL